MRTSGFIKEKWQLEIVEKKFHVHDCNSCIYIASFIYDEEKFDMYVHAKQNLNWSDVILRNGIDGDYWCFSLQDAKRNENSVLRKIAKDFLYVYRWSEHPSIKFPSYCNECGETFDISEMATTGGINNICFNCVEKQVK